MTYQLGLRTLVILAIVVASMVVLVAPELIGGRANANAPLLRSMLALGHA